jgi:citrate lyase subunit beta / citryl-CoA lyase
MLLGPALLFCPGDRPDRYRKALDTADMVILDLEDAVTAANKGAAREALLATPLDPDRVIVRVNGTATSEHAADIETLRRTRYEMIMLPKAEEPAQLAPLDDWRVVALCETPRGILNAAQIAAAPNVIALMWGAEDLIAAIGGRTSRFPGGVYRAVATHARSSVLLAAAAHGRAAVDAVYTDFRDLDGLEAEAEDAAASGFALKACIHPSQVPVVRRAFRPDEAQVNWAERVIAAARGGGAVAIDGQMIDEPLIRQAEAILAATRV